jgi:hypothetical protein
MHVLVLVLVLVRVIFACALFHDAPHNHPRTTITAPYPNASQ